VLRFLSPLKLLSVGKLLSRLPKFQPWLKTDFRKYWELNIYNSKPHQTLLHAARLPLMKYRRARFVKSPTVSVKLLVSPPDQPIVWGIKFVQLIVSCQF